MSLRFAEEFLLTQLREHEKQKKHTENLKQAESLFIPEIATPPITERPKRKRMTTPERKAAKRASSLKHKKKKEAERLAAERSSGCTNPDQIPVSCTKGKASEKQDTIQGSDQRLSPIGFAALTGTSFGPNVNLTSHQKSRERYNAQRREMRRAEKEIRADNSAKQAIPGEARESKYESRIQAIKAQLSAFPFRDSAQSVDLITDAGEGCHTGGANDAEEIVFPDAISISSDEDEEPTERRYQAPAAPQNPESLVSSGPPEPIPGLHPTVARKGLSKETLARMEAMKTHQNDIRAEGTPVGKSAAETKQEIEQNNEEGEQDDSEDSEDEGAHHEYYVTRTELHHSPTLNSPPPTAFQYGPYLTMTEANATAARKLHRESQGTIRITRPMKYGYTEDAHGMQSHHIVTKTGKIETCVSRTEKTTITPNHSLSSTDDFRLPPKIYLAFQKDARRQAPDANDTHGMKTDDAQWPQILLGAFTTLARANRAAGQAWLELVTRGCGGGEYGAVMRGLKETELRGDLEWLEEYEVRFERWEDGKGWIWVEEGRVVGPRN